MTVDLHDNVNQQLDLFRQTATAIRCYWGNECCHDCEWCEGGLMLREARAGGESFLQNSTFKG